MWKTLVVGINDYPSAALKGCVNDANAIAAVLETHGVDGSPNLNVRLLTAPNDTIGRAEHRGAVEKLFMVTVMFASSIFPAMVSSKALAVTLYTGEENTMKYFNG